MVGNLGETPGHRARVRIGLLADHSSNVADEPGRGDLPKAPDIGVVAQLI